MARKETISGACEIEVGVFDASETHRRRLSYHSCPYVRGQSGGPTVKGDELSGLPSGTTSCNAYRDRNTQE